MCTPPVEIWDVHLFAFFSEVDRLKKIHLFSSPVFLFPVSYISFSFFSFICFISFSDTPGLSLCHEVIVLGTFFIWPNYRTCRHGVMCEESEVAGLHWYIQSQCRCIAAGAQPGPVCLCKLCLSNSRGSAESQPVAVLGHSRRNRGVHLTFCPFLPEHSSA